MSVQLVLDTNRSVLPHHDGDPAQITAAWSAASGGAVIVTVSGNDYCVGVVSARDVKVAPNVLRVATFDGVNELAGRDRQLFFETLRVPYLVSQAPGPRNGTVALGAPALEYVPQLPLLPDSGDARVRSLLKRLSTLKGEISHETFLEAERTIVFNALGIEGGGPR
jgi:hypothetical protein